MRREQCSVCEEEAVLYARRIHGEGSGAWEERWFCKPHALDFIKNTDRRWEIKQLPVRKTKVKD